MTDITKNSTFMMRSVCAILFLAFTFVYLHCYQADILAVTQHELSDGRTHYSNLIGAVVITAALFLLQLGVYSFTGLRRRAHALTYFPSLLVLTFITGAIEKPDGHLTIGAWGVAFPLLLAAYAGLVYVVKQMLPYEPDFNARGLFSRLMWINVLTMVAQFLFVGLFSNHNDVFHYRMRMEQLLANKDYAGVLETGNKSLARDSSMTMMRVYALSKEGKLAEKLFEYPITGGSKSLLPDNRSVKLLMYNEAFIYNYLGIRLKQPLAPMAYLDFIFRHHVAKQPAADYLLSAYLLDKNLDAFARNIGRFYPLNGKQLPKHYREALTLYTHLRSNPLVDYHNSLMDTDFQDYQDMSRKFSDKTLRQNNLRLTYGNTYWYYYQYGK